MKRIFLICSLLIFCFELFPQTIKIGLFQDKTIKSISITVRNGKYRVWGDKDTYGEYRRHNIFFISLEGNKIELRDKKNLIGKFDRIAFQNSAHDGILSIRTIDPIGNSIDYDDGIILHVADNNIRVTAKLDMEKYIAGVIEAEGGIEANLEYYKAQAVLVRTYTIKNMYKHGDENFNLCDQVHCQAFKGRSAKNELIYDATKATTGQVLIDRDSILVMSPFHSNCGGITSSAGAVWQKNLPYLKSVRDPFCDSGKHYQWRTQTPKTEWIRFLNKNGLTRELSLPDTTKAQILRRDKYLSGTGKKITYRMIRENFRLKSALLTISETKHEVIFRGRGYGHGVGMCQEGAMEMAQVGYSYKDIIYFYFQNVMLTDFREMELHRY